MPTSSRAAAMGIVVLLALAPASHAASPGDSLHVHSAGDLADLCAAPASEPAGAERRNFCDGYAQGALAMELKREAAIGKPRICIPTPAPTRETTMQEFVKWVRAIPKNAILPPTDGLFMFLSERFPCK